MICRPMQLTTAVELFLSFTSIRLAAQRGALNYQRPFSTRRWVQLFGLTAKLWALVKTKRKCDKTTEHTAQKQAEMPDGRGGEEGRSRPHIPQLYYA